MTKSSPRATSVTNVHRTPFPLRVQLSRRGFYSRGTDRGVRESGNAGDGIARSRWSVRLTAFPSRRKKGGNQGAYRGRSNVCCVFITKTPWWISSSASGRFARWISKSLPLDYQNEAAGWTKRRSLGVQFGFHRARRRFDMPDRWRRRTPGRRAKARWTASRIRSGEATDRDFWPVECLRRTATAFSSRGRI